MLSDDLIPHNLLVYALTYAVQKRHAHNAHIRINRIYQYANYAHMQKTATACAHIRMKLHNPQPHTHL